MHHQAKLRSAAAATALTLIALPATARAELVAYDLDGVVNAKGDPLDLQVVTWGDPISGTLSYETDWQAFASAAFPGSPLAVYLFEPMSATGTEFSLTFGGVTLACDPGESMRISVQDNQPLANNAGVIDRFGGTCPARFVSGPDPTGFFADAKLVQLSFSFHTSWLSTLATTTVIPDDPTIFSDLYATLFVDGDGDYATTQDRLSFTFAITSIKVPPTIESGASVDESATLGSGVFVGSGAQVAKGVSLGDAVSVGENADVRKDSQIGSDTFIGDGAIVKKDATLGNDVIVGAGSIIGTGAHIGDGTVIGASVEIGNGAYLGHDVTIGDGTDVGNDATIGNGVHIGSNCVIGAGAVIGEGAIIGSGVTVKPNAVIPSGATLP